MSLSRRSLLTGASRPDDASSAFNVCSLVVHVRPERLAPALDALRLMAGVEIHGQSAEGKVVVTVELADDHALVRTMGEIGELPGVLSTALVYQHAEAGSSS